ncbi:hypothetical protein BTJ66_09815 [Staphylococcus edaphicus]|uniref:DeoR-like transcriptional repressor C-terminal sensor domain-containing protein n=1 Tax=Staphylococcus edaphicus TaxID=1955013 RepID=A0A2C6WM70_9STAP|nr:hypothetical protein BTJ66_09815 [Staphylococcus edaphicus]
MSSIKKYFEQVTKSIQWDDIIAFDNHPFAYKIIDELYKSNTKVSVISYSTDIIRYVSKSTDFNIIIPNALVDSASHMLLGNGVVETFSKYQIRFYFVSAPFMNKDTLYQTAPAVAEIQNTLKDCAHNVLLMNRPDPIIEDDEQYIEIGEF